MSAPTEAGLWEEGGVREVHGLGERFKTPEELRARGYAFALRYGSEALAASFAWLREDDKYLLPCGCDRRTRGAAGYKLCPVGQRCTTGDALHVHLFGFSLVGL